MGRGGRREGRRRHEMETESYDLSPLALFSTVGADAGRVHCLVFMFMN